MKRCEYCDDLRADEPGPVNACRLRVSEDRAAAAERRCAELEAERDSVHQRVLDARDVEVPCTRCNGYGVTGYGSTSTWRGGSGGQMMTSDVCSECWGSGDANRKWPSHAEFYRMREARKALEADGDGVEHAGGFGEIGCPLPPDWCFECRAPAKPYRGGYLCSWHGIYFVPITDEEYERDR